MKNKKFLTILGVMLAMGLTACGGGKSSAQPQGSSEPEQSQSQGGESSQQGGESSQQGGSQSQQSSQQGGESSQGGDSSSAHEHSFGEWASKKAPTYTELGSEERECACGEKEQRDVNTLPYNIDAASEVVKLNSDNKKMSQFTYNNGAAKVVGVPMKEISAGYKTNAVEGQKEKWTLGDALTLTDTANKDGSDGNLTVGDTYKLTNKNSGVAIAFKVNVTAAVENALISIGGKYKNENPRYFSNHGDGGQNGDNPNNDAYRYYAKVNDGEFQPIAYNNLMSSVFGDGSQVCYMPLGKFNLQAGENTIYVRQANLGYRVTLNGYLFVELKGAAELGGTVPSHTHTAATTWSSDDNEHWHACVGENCDEEGIKLDKAAHEFGDVTVTSAATCEADGAGTKTCSVCGKVVEVVIPALGHDMVRGDAAVNSDGKNTYPITCSRDSKAGYEMAFGDCAGSDKIESSGKVKDGSTLTWKFKGATAGTVDFYAFAKLGSGENPFASGYKLKIGEREVDASVVGKNLSSFGATTSKGVYFLVGAIEIQATDIDENGEVAISYIFPSKQNYRHVYSDNVRIIYQA